MIVFLLQGQHRDISVMDRIYHVKGYRTLRGFATTKIYFEYCI